MTRLTDEAKEVTETVNLIQAHRDHIARRQANNPSPDIDEDTNQARIAALQERVNELLLMLSNDGYEVEYHDTTTIVLKSGQKWLEKTDWTEYSIS